MNLEEYKDKRGLYKRFAGAVKHILEIEIQKSRGYHLHQIQSRPKEPESLRNKLLTDRELQRKLSKYNIKIDENNIHKFNEIEKYLFDLAGCRIIFYYNNDVRNFNASGIISHNFDIKKVKNHNSSYIADHYLVKLNKQRTSLPEYRDFENLYCEIQIHTILNHAGSETEHDIIYKKQNIIGFGGKTLEAIEKQFEEVKKKHLLPAGYAFQNIQNDYQRFLEGKSLFDKEVVQEMEKSVDNNQRYKILERYKTYVLPEIDDYTRAIDESISLVKAAVSLSRNDKKIKDIETPFGNFSGKSSLDVLAICLDILEFIRYGNIETTFTTLLEIFSESKNEREREKIAGTVNTLAKYNIQALENVGLLFQEKLIFILENWDVETLKFFRSLALGICHEIVSPDLQGISNTYNQVTIIKSVLSGTEQVTYIRRKAINILQQLYNFQESDNEKLQIIWAFKTATQFPNFRTDSNELLKIITSDTQTIIDCYTRIIPNEEYDILKKIERDVLFLYHRSKEIIASGGKFDNIFKENNKALMKSVCQFRDCLNENQEFVIYKTLIGYDSIFPESWENREWDAIQYISQKIQEYVESIDDKTGKLWEQRILRCMQIKSSDLATFIHLDKFLRTLGEQKPKFLLTLIENYEDKISHSLTLLPDIF